MPDQFPGEPTPHSPEQRTASGRAAAGGAIALSALLAWCAGAIAFGRASAWHIAHSDLLGLLYLGERMELLHPSTWFSGFYGPVAIASYAVIGGTGASATLLFCTTLAAAAVATLCVARATWMNERSALAGAAIVVLAGCHPAWATWAVTASLDPLAAAALGAALAVQAGAGERSARRWLGAAALVALAGALRVHTLGFGLPWLGLAAWRALGFRRATLLAAGATALALLPSVAASLASGHGFYASDRGFNVYKLIHDIDWRTTDPSSVPTSVLQVWRDDPAAAFAAWRGALHSHVVTLCVGPLAVLASGRERRLQAATLALPLVLYVCAASLGDSDRTEVPVALIALALWVRVGSATLARVPSRAGRVAMGAVGVLAAGALAFTNITLLADEARRRAAIDDTLRQIEHGLTAELGVTDAHQVFADAHDVYLPTVAPRLPNRPGGWPRIDDIGFEQAYPSLCLDDLPCLAQSARAAGVRALLVSPNVGPSTPALMQARSLRAAQDGLVPVGMLGGLLVIAVPPA